MNAAAKVWMLLCGALSVSVAWAGDSGDRLTLGDTVNAGGVTSTNDTKIGELSLDIGEPATASDQSDAAQKLDEDSVKAPASDKLLWGGKRHFTAQQDLSYVTSNPKGVQTNRSSLRFQWNRLFEPSYYVEFDGKAFGYYSNDRKAKEEKRNFSTQGKVKEFFVQGSWANTSVTLGQKVVVWGESETATVTDVFSPRNKADFVFVSLDESRIGQKMFILDQYTKAGQMTFYVNPDVKTDEDPVVNAAGPSDVTLTGKVYEKNIPEFGFRWKQSVGNGDFSLFAADLTDNQRVLKFEGEDGDKKLAKEFYGRYQMVGAAANLNYGDIGVQIEAAYNKSRAQETIAPYSIENSGYKKTNTFQTSLSASYNENGIRVWKLGLSNQHTAGKVNDLKIGEKNVVDVLAGVSDKFFHETLSVSYTYQYQLKTRATIHSLSTQYALTDNLFLMLDYYSLKNLGDDRSFNQNSVFLRAAYNF